MVDVVTQSPTPATAAAPAAASPAAPATLGATFDAEIVLLKSRIGAIETAGKTDWAAVVAWVKTNWAHFVTWGAVAIASPWGTAILKAIL